MGTEKEPEKNEHKAERPPEAPPTKGNEGKEASPLLIGRLTHGDVPDVVALFKRVWEPYLGGLPGEVQRDWQPSQLEFTSGMEGVTYFAARRGNRIIGVIGCRMDSGACELINLAVDSDHRRHGIATALLAAAQGWAEHADARSLHVDVLARFGDAMALLRASGYKEAGVLHKHFWGEDVRIFERVL